MTKWYAGLLITLSLVFMTACGRATAPPPALPQASFRLPQVAVAQLAMTTPHQGWILTQSHTVLVMRNHTWHRVTPPGAPQTLNVRLGAISGRGAWVVYSSGNPAPTVTLEATSDAGQHWWSHVVHVPAPATLEQIDVVSSTAGYLVFALPGGSMGAFGEEILVTHDGGQQWGALPAPSIISARLSFLTAHRGWATGGQTGAGGVPIGTAMIEETVDGGRHWTRQPIPLPAQARSMELTVHPPHFWSPMAGFFWIIGSSPTQPETLVLVYRTIDGGRQWELAAARFWPQGALVAGVSAYGPQAWIQYQNNGVSHLAAFRAHRWHRLTFPGHNVVSMRFINAHMGWAVSGYGTTWITINGGVRWNQQPK